MFLFDRRVMIKQLTLVFGNVDGHHTVINKLQSTLTNATVLLLCFLISIGKLVSVIFNCEYSLPLRPGQ